MRAFLFALLLVSGACVAQEPDNENVDTGGPDAGVSEPDAGEDLGRQLPARRATLDEGQRRLQRGRAEGPTRRGHHAGRATSNGRGCQTRSG